MSEFRWTTTFCGWRTSWERKRQLQISNFHPDIVAQSYLLILVLLGNEIMIQCNRLLLLNPVLILWTDIGVKNLLGLLLGRRLDQIRVLHWIVLCDKLWLLVLFQRRVDHVRLVVLYGEYFLGLFASSHDDALRLKLLLLLLVVRVLWHQSIGVHVKVYRLIHGSIRC